MVILGAKGHALEIVDVLLSNDGGVKIQLFDEITSAVGIHSLKPYPLLHSKQELMEAFRSDKSFIIGVGNSENRKKLADLALSCGGEMASIISSMAYISKLGVTLGKGLNIMHGVHIFPQVQIGEGTLINSCVQIHHESVIGSYCEICPGSVITGNVSIGDFTLVGSGAVILPGVKIGNHVKIGAGAVVVRDVNNNSTITGVPAKYKL